MILMVLIRDSQAMAAVKLIECVFVVMGNFENMIYIYMHKCSIRIGWIIGIQTSVVL
jgi:hypothetical protein